MPITPAASHKTAAYAARSPRDENRTVHVIVVPSILAFVTSAFVAFSSFSTAAGRLDHFCSATSAATAAASVLQAFVGGTLIIVLMKNLSLTSLREARTLSRALRAWAASAALAVATAVLACWHAVIVSWRFSKPLVNSAILASLASTLLPLPLGEGGVRRHHLTPKSPSLLISHLRL